MAPNEIANIVFGRLAENVLREALENYSRSEDILTFPDDLSVGPIKLLDGGRREKWICDNLYLQPEDWGVFPNQVNTFFQSANSRYSKTVCWVCQNSVYELCGFFEYLRQIAGDNLYYVDTMTAAQFEYSDKSDESFPPRLAHVSPMIAGQLIGKEVPVSAFLRAERLNSWERLCAENAPLRSIGPQGVKSVLLSHFDPFLLSFADAKWRPARWVVTRAAVEANNDNFFRVDMMTLTGRLRALVRDGRLEADRDVTDSAMSIRLR